MVIADGYLSILQGCNSMRTLQKLHALIFVGGYQGDPVIFQMLLNFCAISVAGDLNYARLLFNQMEGPQTSAWNSMIRGFSQSSRPSEAILLYNRMMSARPSRPDRYTFTFLLKACATGKAAEKCEEAHGSIIRYGCMEDLYVCTNLVRSYSGNGLVEAARKLFDEMPKRDMVAWNSMLSCYAHAGLHGDSLRLYDQMRNLGLAPDEFTTVAVLSSCAHLGALSVGSQIRKLAYDNGFVRNIHVSNALIDMYAKCGSLVDARQVFQKMKMKDLFTWNSMIMGLGVHGCGKEAISLFRRMLMEETRPNAITFLGVLCGCTHEGLVREGIAHFHMMSAVFGITPEIKHYGCMVDLLGRAGQLENALRFIETSSFSIDPVLWRSLLNACRIHKNVALGEVAMGNLLRIDGRNAGDCVLMSEIYADSSDKQGMSRMRKMIKNQGIKTTRGWSCIELHGTVRRFVVGDNLQGDSDEICDKLKDIILAAALTGYVIRKELSEDQAECSNYYHSELLAMAYGLARSAEGTLRIIKNLRVCNDCHSLTKYVSKAFKREIIVRDRVRFHHFRDGSCSCSDYW